MWEYKVVLLDFGRQVRINVDPDAAPTHRPDGEIQLNALGALGWELNKLQPAASSGNFWAVFRRQMAA